MLVEREIGDEPFQQAVFFFELPEPTQFTHAQVRLLLLPGVERGITHPELPAEVADRGAGLRLPEGIHDLRSSENFDNFMGPLLS